MPTSLLQDMLRDIPFDVMSPNWTTFDLATFSREKRLWDYQQKAVGNALKSLWKYYEDVADYQSKENIDDVNSFRKAQLASWYSENGQTQDLDIDLKKSAALINLLSDYYEIKDNNTVDYNQFLNRACFWMATGSGKTLVIVKLIEILHRLINLGEIPPNDILVLTHRDDLIEQLKSHIIEFNAQGRDVFIRLRELRDYAEAKRDNPSLFKQHEITVFYYRSDNISDEQKEKIIDYRNYDDNGKFYLLLDEAHKGDKEDSKRQHIYSILCRNGFLFNFSATFTDDRDLITTAYNFNLSEFIRAGYGKHIAVLRQETRAFKDRDDYSGEEKQKIVVKSLLLLAYVKLFSVKTRDLAPNTYHRPLLLCLVNSVNIADSDLKLFFRQLEQVAKGGVTDKLWQTAKDELWAELKEHPSFLFEGESVEIEGPVLLGLSYSDVLRHVFNGSKPGDIEILIRPSNRKELAFKLKTSDRPFALIKIGDVSDWLKHELAGYEVNESFEDESYFQKLNSEESDITILMGSRSFYEGWDSNRPNIITFINIGTGTDAKKFILQAVGRGIRIEPITSKRKRLLPLHNGKEIDDALFNQIKDKVRALETLFIFGTKWEALNTVIEHLDQEARKSDQYEFALDLNDAVEGRTLLIPSYKRAAELFAERASPASFWIASNELKTLTDYIKYIGDERVLLAIHNTDPAKIRVLEQSLAAPDDYFKTNGRTFRNIQLLAQRVLDYFDIAPEEFDSLKILTNEIRHFKHIIVSLKSITELLKKVKAVASFEDPGVVEARLDEMLDRGEISREQYKEGIKQTALAVREDTVEYESKRLRIKYLANHYYVPVILSDERDRISYIKHIIQTPSEIAFLNKLEAYLETGANRFKDFDWWLFSKVDESLDDLYIPYYSPRVNKIAHFKPDFVFWLQRGDSYFIVFVDPKGIMHTDYQHKIDGYSELFEDDDGRAKVFRKDSVDARLYVFLHTADTNLLSKNYKKYWFDNIDRMLESVTSNPDPAGGVNRPIAS